MKQRFKYYHPSKVLHTHKIGNWRINLKRETYAEGDIPLYEVAVWLHFHAEVMENYTELEWALSRMEEFKAEYATKLAMHVLGIGGVEPS